jgi:antitoxin (DNA-binding transcriptional repressor) of toxin-antitoxin stability system
MQIGITRARPILHQLLRRCGTERIVLTRNGRPIAQLKAFPRTRQESDRELLRKVAAFVPFEFGGLVLNKEEERHGR